MECLFCNIAKKKISSDIVYENDHVFAFLDIQPIAPGHTVVIPKFHAKTILEIPDNELEPFFVAVKHITSLLEKTFSPEGFTIGINHKEAAGQAVEHFHLHIIPRWKNDGGGSIHNVVKNKPKETNKEILEKIQSSKSRK